MNKTLLCIALLMLTILGLHNIGWMVWGGLEPQGSYGSQQPTTTSPTQ